MARPKGSKNSKPRSDKGIKQPKRGPYGPRPHKKKRKPAPGSRPRDGHAKLCQAKFKKSNRQCKAFALVGSKFCRHHGGRHAARPLQLWAQANNAMPRFYSKYLNKTLNDAVEEALGCSPAEQLQLYEELAMMRETTGTALKLWSAAQETGKSDVIQAAEGLVRSYLQENARICALAASIEANAKDKFSVHNLVHVVNQMTRIAYEVFGEDIDKAKQFEALIKTQIRLPSKESGTLITPDQDVLGMDDSVPSS